MQCEEMLEDELDGPDLCLCCLSPVKHAANFCSDCGAPLGFLAATIPYQRVLAEGYLYRRAIQSPKSILTVSGIWLIFGTQMIVGYWGLRNIIPQLSMVRSLLDTVFVGMQLLSSGWFFIGLAGVIMVTLNYTKHIRTSHQADSPASD
ncbi:hypothetical protein NT6N_32660 [Oceaniferula spumae]|uniref:Zinc ribbon domain-containing protein n=1 Tax=Oceaniferula spumae TaxID=2979115 RepID=A0AAT9FQF7_9BACT